MRCNGEHPRQKEHSDKTFLKRSLTGFQVHNVHLSHFWPKLGPRGPKSELVKLNRGLDPFLNLFCRAGFKPIFGQNRLKSSEYMNKYEGYRSLTAKNALLLLPDQKISLHFFVLAPKFGELVNLQLHHFKDNVHFLKLGLWGRYGQ